MPKKEEIFARSLQNKCIPLFINSFYVQSQYINYHLADSRPPTVSNWGTVIRVYVLFSLPNGSMVA